MSNLDSLQTYSSPSSYSTNSAGAARRPSFERLPKDILEKLEEGKVDEAMQMIKELDEKAAGSKHFLIRWLMQMGDVAGLLTYPFQLLMAGKKKKGIATPQEITPPAAKHAALQQFAKTMQQQLKTLVHFVEQVIQFPFKQALKMANQLKQLLHPPLAKLYQATIAPLIQALAWANHQLLRLQTALSTAIQKKFQEWKEKIDEKAKPVYEWLDTKWKTFVEKQEWLKKVVGEYMQPVMRAADHVIQTIAWVTVPFQLVWNYAEGQAGRARNLFKRAQHHVVERLQRAQQWAYAHIMKFLMLFKKPLLAILYAFLRVLHLLENLLIRLLKWVLVRVKAILLFIVLEIPKRILYVSKSVFQTMRSMSK